MPPAEWHRCPKANRHLRPSERNVPWFASAGARFSPPRLRRTTTLAVVSSPRVGVQHVRAVRFSSIGVPLALVASVAGTLAYLGERLPPAAPYLLAIVGAGALLALGRGALSGMTRSHQELQEAIARREDALRAAQAQLRAMLAERERYEEQIRRLQESLDQRVRERTAALEALNRELESFSYSVSHDLRSPLRHINGYSELLRKSACGRLDASTARYLDTIADAARRASTLVDELLAFARMGRREMRNVEIDMDALVDEVRREVEREVEGRDVRWYVGPLPRTRGDAAMLKLAVRNLLSNALKYSRPRAVAEIRIEAERVGEEVLFRVRDNGVGFDMSAAHSLFGVFKRLHSEAEFEGTGIGLANVRRIIERHGGRTWAEARLGDGATFFFTLPEPGAERGAER